VDSDQRQDLIGKTKDLSLYLESGLKIYLKIYFKLLLTYLFSYK